MDMIINSEALSQLREKKIVSELNKLVFIFLKPYVILLRIFCIILKLNTTKQINKY